LIIGKKKVLFSIQKALQIILMILCTKSFKRYYDNRKVV
jgi:hypothetical protein